MSSQASTEMDKEKSLEPVIETDSVHEVKMLSNAEGVSKISIEPDLNLLESESMNVLLNDSLRDKSQSLIEIANCTFRELCKTLENEQIKLQELEEKRVKLHEEMQRLKVEIEEEKNIYNFHLLGKYKEKLTALKDQQMVNVNEEKEEVQDQNEVSIDEAMVENINTDNEIEYSTETNAMELQGMNININLKFNQLLNFFILESTSDYIKRQRHRLELINQGIPLSELSEDDRISTIALRDDDLNNELTDSIIDGCIPSNLSVLQHNQSFTKGHDTL